MKSHGWALLLAFFALVSMQARASGGHAPNPETAVPESSLGLAGQQYALNISPGPTGSCGWGAESTARKAFQAAVEAGAKESCAPDKYVRVLPYKIDCHSADEYEQNSTEAINCAGKPTTVCGLDVYTDGTAICEERDSP